MASLRRDFRQLVNDYINLKMFRMIECHCNNYVLEGACIELEKTEKFKETKGILNRYAEEEDLCVLKCLVLSPLCLSVDWVENKRECYFYFRESLNPGQPGLNSRKTINWKLFLCNGMISQN